MQGSSSKLRNVYGEVDKDKFEDAIAKNSLFSYDYATNIIKGPFPKGENSIAKNPYYAYVYSKYILNKPFPKGEDAISRRGDLAYKYARNVLKGPFPKGEETIKNSEFRDRYQYFLKELK